MDKDGGMLLELELKKLADSGSPDKVKGMATAFEHAIGKENCAKLAELLKELLED